MPCKILIVEDDANIARYIQTCLTVGNYESEIYSDGLSAVERIGKGIVIWCFWTLCFPA